MDYPTLRKDIELWCNSSDEEFISQINRFIKQAESKIGMSVRLPAYTTQIAVTATGGSMTTTVALPSFLTVDYIFFPLYGILEQKSASFIKEAYPDTLTEMGPLRYFAMQDATTILWGPTPKNTASDGVIQCFSKWPSLVDLGANSATAHMETFISQNFETALLHGCLYYAALFQKDTDMAAAEKQEMMESLGLMANFNTKTKKQTAENGNAAIDLSLS